ncbi:MAG: hypothetical protein EAZ49_29090 [Oscillatoriales cyanobacterium]|nr:MAG: hypothetical protein EAZ49_29090 [Oscillatoriales cyanobacterium]
MALAVKISRFAIVCSKDFSREHFSFAFVVRASPLACYTKHASGDAKGDARTVKKGDARTVKKGDARTVKKGDARTVKKMLFAKMRCSPSVRFCAAWIMQD